MWEGGKERESSDGEYHKHVLNVGASRVRKQLLYPVSSVIT